MALRICLDCTTAYAVGVTHCPHCGSERGEEAGSDPYRGGSEVPKITRHGGPSFADAEEREHPGTGVPMEGVAAEPDGAETVLVGDDDAEDAEDVEEVEDGDDEEEGVASSPGSSSETSSEKPEKSSERNGADRPKRARTTGSRSAGGRAAGSTARSTDTGGRKTGGSSDN